VEIAGLNVKESRTAYLPVLSMNGGLFASDVQNSAGSLLQNRTMGPQVSGTLSVPLYRAGEVKRKLNIAKIELQSANVNLEKMRQLARIDMQNAITNYRYQMNLLDIEINNNQLSEEYLKISIQRFRLGQVNSLEVHLAQENFVQSNTRLINYRFNLKMAETRLKQLSSLL
jgi:outer membrane protein TolC